MDKKGSGEAKQIGLITELIIGVLVIGILYYLVHGIYTNDEFNKIYVEKEVSLMMNTLEGLPGDIELSYTLNKGNYNFFVSGGEVNIGEEDQILNKPKVIRFFKKGEKIFLSQEGLEIVEINK